MTCDHLTDRLKDAIHDSETVSKLKLHRTKCTAIIKNVLNPHF